MKKLCFILICTMMQFAYGNSNPQMRTCRIHQGQFWTYDIHSPSSDNIGFCRFKSAMIDSVSFMHYAFTNVSSESMTAYLDSLYEKYDSCKDAGGKLIDGKDSGGEIISICFFQDYSFIERDTLVRGWYSEENRELNSALNKM